MVTLTGTFTRLDGTPATGTVRVTPSRSPIMDSDGKIVISGPQVFPLDMDGKLAVEIPASDDPDLGPAFTYSIDVNLAHASWKISKVWIPHGTGTVDLSEIGDYQPVPGVATRVVTIPADGADGQVLVWDGAGFTWDYPPTGPKGDQGDPGTSDIVVDTSVGTRVFANGIMLHGDTGWRTISSWTTDGELTGTAHPNITATPGVAGSIQVRRENTVVTVAMRGITLKDAGATLNLPTGFQGTAPYLGWPATSTGTVVRVSVGGTQAYFSDLGGDATLSATYGAALTFRTDRPWPTTLPGLPS